MVARVLGILVMLAPGLAWGQMQVGIVEPGGLVLRAKLFLPAGRATGLGVVALHGCAGPLKRRDDAWAARLAAAGHPVLLPDSFGSRGLGPQCRARVHAVDAYGARRGDALAAAAWLKARAFTPAGGVVFLGWSDGGETVLAAVAAARDVPAGLVAGGIAFYPACARTAEMPGWRPAAPVAILMGADDDWTPVAPCERLAAGHPQVRVTLFPGAYHDFDVPDDPVHEVGGLPYTLGGDGVAHAGENAAARAAAAGVVAGFLAGLGG